MQKLGYAKSTAVRSYREVNMRARVSVSLLKWKAIISDGVIAWVVQLRTKTCNSNAVLLVDWRGNNKMTRSQSHTHSAIDRCQKQCCSVASIKLLVQYGRASRRRKNESMWAPRVSNGAETHAADLQTRRRHAHSHLLSRTRSLRETVSDSPGRQVGGVFSFVVFERWWRGTERDAPAV